jgi:hypothetical protein
MTYAVKNLADSVVATPPSPATSGLSFTVAAGTGSRYPTEPFHGWFMPANARPSVGNAELVVATVSGDTVTITARAQEGTTARAVVAGDVFYQCPSAADLLELVALGDTPTWTSSHTWEQSIAANVTAAAQNLVNPAAATSGNQRFSPAQEWEGFGWETATATSKSVRFRSFVEPVQSSRLADSKFLWQASVDNGAWEDALSIKPAGGGGTLEGNTWDVFNLTVTGTMITGAITGLFSLGLIDNGAGLFSYTLAVVDSVGATADRGFYLDPRDGDRVFGLEADWTLGTYAATAPTPTGYLTVTVAGQAYEILARLVP